MKTIATILPAAGLALLLLSPAPRAQSPSQPGSAGVGPAAPAQPALAPPANNGPMKAGGDSSGGGELPKAPVHGPMIRKQPPSSPPTPGPAGPMPPQFGKGGNGAPDPGPDRHPKHPKRRHVLAGPPAGTGSGHSGAGAALSAPPSATSTSAPSAATLTVVRVLDAAGQPVAGALVIASSARGATRGLALTDVSGIALLRVDAAAGTLMHLDVLSATSASVALRAGSTAMIVVGD
jgi:hypothetical protein